MTQCLINWSYLTVIVNKTPKCDKEHCGSLSQIYSYPSIDSWVSWVEPGLPRKPSS